MIGNLAGRTRPGGANGPRRTTKSVRHVDLLRTLLLLTSQQSSAQGASHFRNAARDKPLSHESCAISHYHIARSRAPASMFTIGEFNLFFSYFTSLPTNEKCQRPNDAIFVEFSIVTAQKLNVAWSIDSSNCASYCLLLPRLQILLDSKLDTQKVFRHGQRVIFSTLVRVPHSNKSDDL